MLLYNQHVIDYYETVYHLQPDVRWNFDEVRRALVRELFHKFKAERQNLNPYERWS